MFVQQTLQSEVDGLSLMGDRQVFTSVASYKKMTVAIKFLSDVKIELTRAQLLELKVMTDLHNDHLAKFYGACLDPHHCCIVTEYCPKGSLQVSSINP